MNGSTPLEVPFNYSHKVVFDVINVTIWNPIADTFEHLDHKVELLTIKHCSVSKVYLLSTIDVLYIVNSEVVEIEIINWQTLSNVVTQKIEVRNTSITSIPINIDKLVQLESIEWSMNNLESLNLSSLNGLNKLRYATFINCSISEVTGRDPLHLPSLLGLVLKQNNISHIETNHWSLPKMFLLNLDNNQLSQVPTIKHFTSLRALHLRENLISNIDYADLSPLKNLTILLLSYNRILHLDSWSSIHLPKVKTLHLNSNHLRRLDVRTWRLPKLKDFFIEDNQLRTIEGFESIAGGLRLFSFGGNPWDCAWVHFAMVELKEQLQSQWVKSCRI